jgi:MFS family permease
VRAAVALPAQPRLLTNLSYALLLAAVSISLSGDEVQRVAMAALTLDLTGQPSGWAAVLTAGAVPQAAFMLLGGVATDRFRPRTVMLVGHLALGVATAALLILVATGGASLWHLLVVSAVTGTLLAFVTPALFVMVPFVVPPAQVQRATALSEAAGSAAQALMPPVAGVLVAAAGSAPGFALNALSFFVSAACVWGIRETRQGSGQTPAEHVLKESVLAQLAGGFRAATSDIQLWMSIVLGTILSLGSSMAFMVGLPALSKLELAAGDQGIGALYGAFGLGALAGTLVSLVFRPRRAGLTGSALVLGYGLCLGATGLAPTVAIALPLLVVAGLCNMLAGMIFLVLLQTRPSETVRGRVMSLLLFGVFGLSPLWYTVAGFLGDAVGPRWLVVAGGGVSLIAGLVGAATWLRLPAEPVRP